jgi:hypothetical protein
MATQVQPGRPGPRVVNPGLLQGSTVAVAGASPTGGTIATPKGPITWTQSPDGTIKASGGGQTLAASGQNRSDGSFQKHAAYARTGQAPYLTMDLVSEAAQHSVALTLSAGASHLTLTIANIDAGETSGTAILSGMWKGAPVHWTGHADLTSNPLVGSPIKGWPAGAFTTELNEAAFFAPLEKALAQTVVQSRAATTGARGGLLHIQDAAPGTVGRAAAWCVGGAVAGSKGGIWGVALGCAGGALASLASDLISWEYPDIPDDPPPPPDPPMDPEPTGPFTQTVPDDPPPPPDGGEGGDNGGGGGGGSGDTIDGSRSTHEED